MLAEEPFKGVRQEGKVKGSKLAKSLRETLTGPVVDVPLHILFSKLQGIYH